MYQLHIPSNKEFLQILFSIGLFYFLSLKTTEYLINNDSFSYEKEDVESYSEGTFFFLEALVHFQIGVQGHTASMLDLLNPMKWSKITITEN